MDQKDYELILSLNKTKNITKTAEQLFVSQPALTKRIQNIEKELGTNILVRMPRGIYFTPMGEKVLDYVLQIYSSIEEMHSYIHSNMGYIGGNLEIGVPVDYARYLLPQKLDFYIHNYPNVNIYIHTGYSSTLYRRLMNNDFNCTVARGEYNWDEEQLLIRTEPVCLACKDREARKNLSKLIYINRSTDTLLSSQIHKWLKENNLHWQTKLNIDGTATCQQLIRSGLWTIAPQLSLFGFDGYMEPLYLADGTPLLRETHILCRSFYMDLPQVRLFIDLLRQHN